LLAFAPWLMKALGVVGTLAMFMVGGGILVHGIHALDLLIKQAAGQLAQLAAAGPLLAALLPTLAGMAVGMVAGALVLSMVNLWQRMRAA
jgi:predicted DNA repair protein MutK